MSHDLYWIVTLDLITDIIAMLFAVYDTYVTMVTGNFDESDDL